MKPRPGVRSFGGLSIWRAGETTGRPPAPMQRRLLGCLLLAPWGPPLEVHSVCDALWPDADGDTGRSNFSSAVRRLRLALGDPAALVISGGTVSIDSRRCRSDLDLLVSLAGRRDWRCDATRAASLARCLLAVGQGYNPVLIGRPDTGDTGACALDDMARRRSAAGAAWQRVSLRIAAALEGSRDAGLGVSLCIALDRHGLADERVLAQWQRLAQGAEPGLSPLSFKPRP